MPKKSLEKQLFIIIDANAILHRAYHALPRLTNSRGELTNAVYGFALVLLKVLKEFKPQHIAAAFDVAAPTFRDKEYKEYKATRKKAPDDLYEQIPKIKDLLRAFNIPIYEQPGYEADDLIGTVVELLEKGKKDLNILIVSGDLDTLQLVSANTKVYTMRKGVKDTIIYDQEHVQERFNLSPKQLADYKGLRGDPSDNIIGVPGVGEISASQLLERFGTLEDLYKVLQKGDVEGVSAKMREKLLENKEQAFFSRMLATIKKDVPIKFDLSETEWGGFDAKEVQKLFKELSFRALIARLSELKGFEAVKQTEQASGAISRKKQLLEEIEMSRDAGILSDKIYQLEKELVEVILKMEKLGIGVDVVALKQAENILQKKLNSVEKKIYKVAGTNFNINSPAQLGEVLFVELKIDEKGVKKTTGGKISTAANELEKLKGKHKIIDLILQQRELQKILSTYIKPLAELADKSGRVHSTFKPFGTSTGRISSTNPNLQNIPIRGEWAPYIRKAFRAEKGNLFLSCDYSQIELRVAAHLANDSAMIDAFRKDKDIHISTAAAVFGVSEKDVDANMRYRAKALNFGIIYGIGPKAFAQSAEISFEEAREFIQRYLDVFEGVAAFMDSTKLKARQLGYVETMFGRKRFLPDLNSPNPMLRSYAERAAINMPVQGSAADIMKMAMVKAHKELPDLNMILQIHDELLWEGKSDTIKKQAPGAAKILEDIVKLKVPLKVEYKIGKNWGELKV